MVKYKGKYSLTPKTEGEKAFERCLISQGISDFTFEPECPGKSRHPDYSIVVKGKEYLFDVKDFEFMPDQPGGAYDPYRRIRGKLDEAREKFREFQGLPCCLVLYARPGALVDLEMPEIILGSMLGNAGFRVPLNQPSEDSPSDDS